MVMKERHSYTDCRAEATVKKIHINTAFVTQQEKHKRHLQNLGQEKPVNPEEVKRKPKYSSSIA